MDTTLVIALAVAFGAALFGTLANFTTDDPATGPLSFATAFILSVPATATAWFIAESIGAASPDVYAVITATVLFTLAALISWGSVASEIVYSLRHR